MTKLVYEVVQHDGGWAYRADGVYSETFPSHDAARAAADHAAQRQAVADETTAISYEDTQGKWHTEVSRGTDRPDVEVKG